MFMRTILTGLVGFVVCLALPDLADARSPMPPPPPAPPVVAGAEASSGTPATPPLRGTVTKYSPVHSGYVVRPTTESPAPAILIIHAYLGLTDEVRREADGWADRGYAVLAVDLYGGKVAADSAEARLLKGALVPETVIANLNSGFQTLVHDARVDPKRIAVLGWCMGGMYSLHFALHCKDLAACVVYYGKPVTDPKALAAIRAPVIGVFGEADASIPLPEIAALRKELDALKIPNDLRTYPDSKHAFANPGAGSNYNPETARLANRFVEESLAKLLLSPPAPGSAPKK